MVSIGSGVGNRREGRGQDRRAIPRRCPAIDVGHGTFRDVARQRSEAIEPLLANAIGQCVDQVGDICLGGVSKARNDLFRRERLGQRRGESHDLDAKAGIDGLDLVAEEPSQTPGVADGQRRADTDCLQPVIGAMQKQIEAPI